MSEHGVEPVAVEERPPTRGATSMARVQHDYSTAATASVALTVTDLLPRPVLVTAAWAIAVIVIAAAGKVLADVVGAVSLVVVPVLVAILIAALLHPLDVVLRRAGLHPVVSSLISVLAPTLLVIGGIGLAGTQIATGAAELAANAQAGVDSILAWLNSGPLHLTNDQINQTLSQASAQMQHLAQSWAAGALDAGVAALDVIAGVAIALITTFFFVLDGPAVWAFVVKFLPRRARSRVHEAGRRGWVSLGAYSRAQIVVAGVDAAGITLGAFVLGLPLILPLFVLVFIASFVPIIGTVIAGLVPVLIAFVSQGPMTALIMLGIVLLVQQVEAHLLQPFLMGKAVALHPLAVVLAVAAATFLYGIAGALFAVPVLAFVNSAGRYLAGDDPFPALGTDRLDHHPTP
ncbi:MAG: AI-2E family transporter [Mobilicoccus sp.]|nr:AI-2E family transporter [Mobilicoccus sp.]